MKTFMMTVILLGIVSSCVLNQPQLFAQGCEDDEAMVADLKKDLVGLVETTRKESLPDFEKAYHQKACLTKLGLCSSMMDELLSCLEKASADPAATKEQTAANKAKRDAGIKFKEKLEGYRKSLKAIDDSKEAKVLIDKFDFSD